LLESIKLKHCSQQQAVQDAIFDAVTNFDIETITCTAFKEDFNNGLAGWVGTFDLVTHNPRPRCLYDLLSNP
jgi:hypothetical protein